MLRLAFSLLLAGAFLLAVWTWVPIGGRTLSARWHASAGVTDFSRRTLAELGVGEAPRPAPGARARTAPRDRAERSERVSEADRQALERRLADELRRDGAAP
jgi:hypothetical protein